MYIERTFDTSRISAFNNTRVLKNGYFYILAFPELQMTTSTNMMELYIYDVISEEMKMTHDIPQSIRTNFLYTLEGNDSLVYKGIFEFQDTYLKFTFDTAITSLYTIKSFSLVWLDTTERDASDYEWYGIESETIPNAVAVDSLGNVATFANNIFRYKSVDYSNVTGYISGENTVMWWNDTHIFPENIPHNGFFPNGKGMLVKNENFMKLPNGQTRWVPTVNDSGIYGIIWYILYGKTLLIGQTHTFSDHTHVFNLNDVTTDYECKVDVTYNLIAITSKVGSVRGVSVFRYSTNNSNLTPVAFIPIDSRGNLRFISESVLCINGLFYQYSEGAFYIVSDARLWVHPDLGAKSYAISRNKVWDLRAIIDNIGVSLVWINADVSNVSSLLNTDRISDYPYTANGNYFTLNPMQFPVGFSQFNNSSCWLIDGGNSEFQVFNGNTFVPANLSAEQVAFALRHYWTNFCGHFSSYDGGVTWFKDFEEQTVFVPADGYPYWNRLIEFTTGYHDVMTGDATDRIHRNTITILAIVEHFMLVMYNGEISKIFGNHKFAICSQNTIYTKEGVYIPRSENPKKWRLALLNYLERKSTFMTVEGYLYQPFNDIRYYTIANGLNQTVTPNSTVGQTINYTRTAYNITPYPTPAVILSMESPKVAGLVMYRLNGNTITYTLLQQPFTTSSRTEMDSNLRFLTSSTLVNLTTWEILRYSITSGNKIATTWTFNFESYQIQHGLAELFSGWKFSTRVCWNTITNEVYYDYAKTTDILMEKLTDEYLMYYIPTTQGTFLINVFGGSDVPVVFDADDYSNDNLWVKDGKLVGKYQLPENTGNHPFIHNRNQPNIFCWNDTIFYRREYEQGKYTFLPILYNANCKFISFSSAILQVGNTIHCIFYDETNMVPNNAVYTYSASV